MLVVAAAFWIRIFHAHATRKLAREITFVGPNGPVDSVNCHGSALIDGDIIWQLCSANSKPGILTRIDPTRGVGEMLWAPPVFAYAFGGFAKEPSGTPIVVFNPHDKTTVYRVKPAGGLEPLGTFENGVAGLAANGDAIEVVSGRFSWAHSIHTLRNGAWSERKFSMPALDDEHWLNFQGAERRDGAWRVVYVRGPSKGVLPIDADVMVGTEAAPLEKVGTIRIGRPFVHAFPDGSLDSMQGSLHVVHGNMIATMILGELPYEWEDGKVRAPDPPVPPMLSSYDFAYRPHGHEPILVIEGPKHAARIHGEWFLADGDRRLQLTRLRDGKTSMPVDRFWVDVGYKLFPAAGSGYWMTGALTQAYVRLGDDLARTDELTFFERLGRLFRQDRGKRNSDIYWGNATLEKFAVGWALFPPIAIALAALIARKHPRLDFPVFVAAATWLVVMVFAMWRAWRIVWFF
jgi:hypothetical protein